MAEKQLPFPAEIIVMNRDGYMTPAQARMLRHSLGRYEGTMIFLLVALIPALLCIPRVTGDWMTTCLIAGLFVAGLALLADFQWTVWRDARGKRCMEMVGQVWSVTRAGKGKTHFEIWVKDSGETRQIIKTSKEVAHQFSRGSCYRFFYAPRSHILLSAEKVTCTV